MTKNERFKKRVRARMVKTGEKYGAARRALTPASATGRRWVSEPEMGDDAISRGTGRGWDEWCDLIEAWPGSIDGHAPVAAWLHAEHGIDHWWAQGITVGWERITGRRLPGQRSDGTFSVSQSKVMAMDSATLRALLLDDADRQELLGISTSLRSRATSKSLRVQAEEGSLLFTLTERADGRTAVVVAHERLPGVEASDHWRSYWRDWLEAMADASAGEAE